MRSRRTGALVRCGAGAAVAGTIACSSTPTGTLQLTTGGEADAFTRAPAPVSLVVDELAVDGSTKEIARTALPAGDVDLGEAAKSDTGAIRVRALDGAGNVLLAGETLFFQFGALEGSTLEVFVQRTGELARLPRPPAALDLPGVDVIAGRYLLQASGTSTTLYDLLLLDAMSSAPALARPARSLATLGTVVVAIDEDGASAIDLGDGTTAEPAAPPGGTFSDVAGGATIAALDGSEYVVGGTRVSGAGGAPSAPSARVLRISASGAMSFASLSAPRRGACAAWVEGRGLVVVGGDPTAPGVEVLAPDGTQAAALAYPPDAVTGCGAAALDATHVVVAGGTGGAGTAGARVIDLACAASCQPAPWPGAVPLARADAVALSAQAALFGGDDASGATHLYRASPTETHEVPLRTPRRGGRLVVLPIDAAAVVGGAADVETYRE
jgi:hypothetical protein